MGSDARPWWRGAVIYQVYPRSFADGDGDGIGDLAGLTSRLDHLAQLGVDAVWLGPVYPSPQRDNGYDVAAYTDVDPTFGTLADLDALIAAAHDRGLRVVLDVVFNHSSDQHPWFQASRSSRDDPKRDWYLWRGPRPGHEPGAPGAEPTNWRAAFSGSAWTYDPATGEYHLGVFSPWQPDLNWEHPEVRAALHDVLRFWIDRGVDGFRMDVINFIAKHPDLPDGEVPAGRRFADHGPFVIDQPRVHDHLAELRREVLGERTDVALIGEMPGATVATARRYTDPANREVDLIVQFEHLELDHGPGGKWDPQPLDLVALKGSLGRWQDGLADAGWNSLYLSNHDQPRQVSRFAPTPDRRVDAAKAIATVLHLQRGTPFVYQGEELGLPNAPLDTPDDLLDIESRNHLAEAVADGADPDATLATMRAMARDTSRSPVPWDDTAEAGFTTGTPWMRVAPEHRPLHAAGQWADPGSVLHHYRRLIALRHAEPVVLDGTQTMLLLDHPRVFAYRRDLGDTSLLVLAELTGEPVRVTVPDLAAWQDAEVVLVTGGDATTALLGAATDELRLTGWQAVALVRRRDPAQDDGP